MNLSDSPDDYNLFSLGDVDLQSGQVLVNAKLAYKTWGKLNSDADNVILLPTFYTGTHVRNQGFIGSHRALNPEQFFIVSVNLFGNGISTSPSNADAAIAGPNFPRTTLYDNVKCQHRLLSEALGVKQIKLVTGWSMAGCQSFQWAAQYPDKVEAIIPFCGSSKTSPHNIVFLEGVKAALQADQDYENGCYTTPPQKGLKAFARVYAGWAYSQSFYREGLYRQLGFDSYEELLLDWENDHLQWDANDLLAMLWTWQNADISDNPLYGGDFEKALGAIKARTIVIPCSDDLYFPPEDNAIEVDKIPDAELRIYSSPWGHCVASPGNDPGFQRFLDQAVTDILS